MKDFEWKSMEKILENFERFWGIRNGSGDSRRVLKNSEGFWRFLRDSEGF